ncbi:MAG: hypothetical protein M1133_13560 [Armatimonadetes bacterium]|nr:hypothetical protein [Armatimonadota bacterium]
MKLIHSLALAVLAVVWHIAILRASSKLGLLKLNFNKTQVMASYGIVAFGYIAALVCSLALLGYARWADARLYLAVMGAMWALGVLDDLFGSREVGGFKGHFKKLIFERKITTGAVKAIGGGIVGVCAGMAISGGEPARWISSAMLIPLAANLLNLLDLRPGRAVAVFFFGFSVTCILARGGLVAPWIVGAVAAVAVGFWLVDSRGRAMMGDSGSNALGAAMGITMALNTGLAFQFVVLAIIAGIHLYSEKHSITALIERNPVLRCIDRRLGVR